MHDEPALTFRELLAYTATENEKWRRWLLDHPEALEIPIGAGRTATIRGLVHHIIVVELRYIDRLRGETVTEYNSVPSDSLDTLFDAASTGRERLAEWLGRASADEMGQRIQFETISAGTFSVTKRKILAHTLLHGIRHWAQIATKLRESGFEGTWQHDLLMSDALE